MSFQGVAIAAFTVSLGLYLQGCGGDAARDLMSSCEELDVANGKVSASGRVTCNKGFAYSGAPIGCANALIRMCPSEKRDGGSVKDGSAYTSAADCADLAGHVMKADEKKDYKPQYLTDKDDHGGILSINSEKDALRAKGQILQEQNEAKMKAKIICSASVSASVAVAPPAKEGVLATTTTVLAASVGLGTSAAPVKLFDSEEGDTLQGHHLGSFAAVVALMGFVTLVVVVRRRTGSSQREIDVESELEMVLDGVE